MSPKVREIEEDLSIACAPQIVRDTEEKNARCTFGTRRAFSGSPEGLSHDYENELTTKEDNAYCQHPREFLSAHDFAPTVSEICPTAALVGM